MEEKKPTLTNQILKAVKELKKDLAIEFSEQLYSAIFSMHA